MDTCRTATETELFDARPRCRRVAVDPRRGCRSGGGDVYLVGGTLRDLILGREFLDVDLAVDGDALSVGARRSARPKAPSRDSARSGVHRRRVRYDLARTRAESYPQPGALPEVEPAESTTTSAAATSP